MTILKGTVPSLVTRLRQRLGDAWALNDEAADRIEQLEEIVREVMAGRYDDALLLTANLEGMDE